MSDHAEEGASKAEGAGKAPNIQQLVATRRMQQAQAQVGEVVDLMRVNVEKVIERDQKLTELDRRAVELHEGASQFQQQTGQLKRKSCWAGRRTWWLTAAAITAVLLLGIILVGVSAAGAGAGTVETVETAQAAATSVPEHAMPPVEVEAEAGAKP